MRLARGGSKVGEAELGGVRAVPAHLLRRPGDREAGRALLDDQQADAAEAWPTSTDRRGDEVATDAGGDERLGPVDDAGVDDGLLIDDAPAGAVQGFLGFAERAL